MTHNNRSLFENRKEIRKRAGIAKIMDESNSLNFQLV